MPNKDLRKYNKGDSFLPMKAEGEAPLFLKIFAAPRNIGGSKKNLYIFGGGGGIFKKSYRKRNLRRVK
jgi:hypothetical protein